MKLSTQDKIAILAESAKYDVSCSSSGSEHNYKTGELGNTHKAVFAIPLPVMVVVYRFLKSYFPTSVFMIVRIVLTVRAMTSGVLHLPQESLPI